MEKHPWVPIIIALIVSTVGGILIAPVLNFWAGFGLALLLQIIIGSCMNNYLQNKTALVMEEQLTRRISDAAKQTLKLKCPCTNMSEQIIPIRLDQPNFYKCINCEKNISVNLQASTALMTEVINIDATHEQMVQAMSAAREE